MSDVEDHQGFVDVHFKITARPTKSEGDVVRDYLDGNHRERFALGRIDLAWHDRRSGFIFRDRQFGEPGSGSTRHKANVVADLVERDGQRPQRAGQLDQRVVSTLYRKLVGRGYERQPSEAADL